MLEEKILQIGKQEMVNVFLKAWNPLIEFEQISLNTLAQGLLYWEALAPISERWKDIDAAEVSMGFASREELIKQRVLGDREFSEELELLLARTQRLRCKERTGWQNPLLGFYWS